MVTMLLEVDITVYCPRRLLNCVRRRMNQRWSELPTRPDVKQDVTQMVLFLNPKARSPWLAVFSLTYVQMQFKRGRSMLIMFYNLILLVTEEIRLPRKTIK